MYDMWVSLIVMPSNLAFSENIEAHWRKSTGPLVSNCFAFAGEGFHAIKGTSFWGSNSDKHKY